MSLMKTMFATAGADLGMALGGFGYSVVAVGASYQDATQAQATAERSWLRRRRRRQELSLLCGEMGEWIRPMVYGEHLGSGREPTDAGWDCAG